MTKAERSVNVRWTGRDLVFEGRWNDGAPILLDSGSQEGPSPTEALLMSLAACMAVDVRIILEKGRVPVDAISVGVTGTRAEQPPRRFTRVQLSIEVAGPSEADAPKLERAVQLSRDTYCSVFHTLRGDIDVDISATRVETT